MGSDLLFLLRKLKTGSFVSILDTMLAEQPSAQGVLRVHLKTPNAPGQRAFLRCAASFFLEIRQYSCEKMSCATQKSLAAGHIMSFQIHPSIRRYVLPLLTSWKQKKSPGSIALQWIRAVRFHASSLSDTYGHRSRFRHYVLTPPIPFSQIIHRKTEPLPPCQCCLQRVALADSQGAADFLGDHDAAEVVPLCQVGAKKFYKLSEKPLISMALGFPDGATMRLRGFDRLCYFRSKFDRFAPK